MNKFENTKKLMEDGLILMKMFEFIINSRYQFDNF